MASIKDTQLIEKLNANNYANWSFKMQMLLIKEDLFSVITDDPPDPITTEFTKRDNKARALINLFIDDGEIVHVRNLQSARLTWDTLKGIHERTNLSSKLYLLRKLYSLKLDERGNVQKHITQILELTDRLKAIGEEIKDSHISALFLCSLPPSYEPLITALEARSEIELTPQFISSKLIDEFNRRKENNAIQEHSNKVYQASNNSYNKKQNLNTNKRYGRKFCTYCKRNNHLKSECYHLKNKNFNLNKNKNNEYKQFNSSQFCQESQFDKALNLKCEPNDMSLFIGNPAKEDWIIDSGSTSHISNNKSSFVNLKESEQSEVMIANGNKLKSYGIGDIKIKTATSDGNIKNITLKDTLFVPDLQSNLFSVKKAAENGCKILFKGDQCKISHNGTELINGHLKNNLYHINLDENKIANSANIAQQCNNDNCIHLWHRRTGHKNFDGIKQMINKNLAVGIKLSPCKHELKCLTCIKAKLTDNPYPKATQNRSNKTLELIHSDVCGPMTVPTIGGKLYFVTFIDDYSRYAMVYLLTRKSEVLEKLKEFIALVTNQFGRKPQAIRTDNGGEFTGNEMENFLKQNGIKHQKTIPRCEQQNGVAERKNRTLVEMVRSMLSDANLNKRFWGEALNTANYLTNRLVTKANEKTPFELWYNQKPNLSHLRVFGSKAFAYIDKTKRAKLDDKAIQGTFVGYDEHAKGYRIYVDGKGIILSRTVKFLENPIENIIQNSSDKQSTIDIGNGNSNFEQKIETDTIEVEISSPTTNEAETSNIPNPAEPRRSKRENKGVPPDRLIYLTESQNTYEPKNFEDFQNIANPSEKENWQQAMNEEIKSLHENNTWTLVNAPPGKRVIGSKWTYKIKCNSNGEIVKHKARLVAKGYSQKYGEDYFETFAPVVSYTTIRALLTAATYKNLDVHHLDVKTAFLHGNLEETVYMTQPDGYISPGNEGKVCKLEKAIYGLKQAARAWQIKIAETLKKFNFTQSLHDQCLYTKHENDSSIYIIVYVDDILISGKLDEIKQIVNKLRKEFEIKDLGEIKYYLGIEVERNTEGQYLLNQKSKIEELVKRFNLTNAKPYSTPMESGYHKLIEDENILPNNKKYRQAVGSLLYIATITRPDIAAAVNILTRRNEKPRQMDWSAVKRVISYLNNTKHLNLKLSAEENPVLSVYTDSDWAGDKTDRKSTSGNLFLLGSSPIQWSAKKQQSVSLSSAEAEYISAASAIQEMNWLLNLLRDLDIPQNIPTKVFLDNQSCLKMISDPKYTSKTKHVDIRHHYIRDIIDKGLIDLEYCPTKRMIADIFTKPLPRPDFVNHRLNLQLHSDNTFRNQEGVLEE